MMTDDIEVEVNLMALGKMKTSARKDMNRAQDKERPSTSQTSDERFEAMMRNTEQMIERMALGNMHNPIEQDDEQPKNLRRPTITQIRQREPRNQGN
jgi:hypothetical protein